LLPASAATFSFGLDAEANAVSATAQYAANRTRTAASTQGNRLPSSIEDKQLLFFIQIKDEFYHSFPVPSIPVQAEKYTPEAF
jgi:hypothetical protein